MDQPRIHRIGHPQGPIGGVDEPQLSWQGWRGRFALTFDKAYNTATGNPSGEGADRLLNGANQSQALWDSTTNETFYLGFQANFGTVPAGQGMGYHGIEFFPSSVTMPGENRSFDIGYNQYNGSASQTDPARAKLGFTDSPFNQVFDGAPASYNQDGITHLIVMKWVFSSVDLSDSLTVYLDPTNATEPAIPSASVTNVNLTLGAIGVAQFGDVAGNPLVLDELRVGTTFADAVPSFPVPGDTDDNGTVDLVDYQHIVDHMGLRNQTTLNGDIAKSDGTQGVDGIVDINDFRLWKSHFARSLAPAPERASRRCPRACVGYSADWRRDRGGLCGLRRRTSKLEQIDF